MGNVTTLKEAINNSNMNPQEKAKINNYIDIITKMYFQVPIPYYAAALYGLLSIIVGVIHFIPFAVLCGVAVFLIALLGIGEVLWRRYRIR